MSQPENKPKLSDIARQTNADKAKRFSATMIPAPPKPKEIATDPASDAPAPIAEGSTGEEPQMPAVTVSEAPPAPVSTKATRPRRGGAMTIEDVISHDPPKGEPYPNQIRVSAKHHKLLRKLAFTHEVTINHIMYNLLDLLEQADQRDQQKGD